MASDLHLPVIGMRKSLLVTLHCFVLAPMLAACHAREPSTPPVAATQAPKEAAAVDAGERPPASPAAIARFVGEYTYVGGDAQRQSARAALESAVEGLDPISRRLAQRKLAQQDPAIPSIAIDCVDGQTSIARLDSVVRAPLGGGPVTFTRNGHAVEVTHALPSPLQLVETLQGPRGRTINTFVLSEDGRDLTLTTQIESNHQRAPAVYPLSYRRRAPEG